jgi:hypothetical protein
MIRWTYIAEYPVTAALDIGLDNLARAAKRQARRMAGIHYIRVFRDEPTLDWTYLRLILDEEVQLATFVPCPKEQATMFVIRLTFDAEPMVDVVPDL